MSVFKDALAREMERAGFNKAGLAAALRVDKSTITKWTNGQQHPDRKRFARLIQVLPRLKGALDD